MRKSIITLLISLALLVLHACSGAEEPDNLEPVLTILPAESITRTEALIGVHIENRGPGRLSQIRFHYGEAGNIDRVSDPIAPEGEDITLALKDLKPGKEYSYFAEGSTATATLRSETMSFSTEPNDRPKVSGAEPLSTGPIGIIIGFDITDDGGEALTEAGCIVETAGTGVTTRLYLPDDRLSEGSQRVVVNGLTPETDYIFTPFAANTAGETLGEPLNFTSGNSIVLLEPGVLESLLGSKINLRELTITGELNGDDFHFLRLLLGAPLATGEDGVESDVTDLDLTDARIVEGGKSYDGSRFTETDIISTDLFSACTALLRIQLPSTATRMARNAFADCTALETLTVPASVAEVLPSGGCTALKAIEVSKANPNYCSISGVLFNSTATEILWFPLGKKGAYKLPSSIIAIGESAFAGTSITSLTIPSSVTVISRGAFAASSLEEISLPDNITNISEGMFQGCASLTTIYLGSGTEYVGNYVFDGTSITNLYVAAPFPPVAAEDAFVSGDTSIASRCTLHVPKGSKSIYRNHRMWGQFTQIVEF